MLVAKEISLKDFEFWGGAKALADKLTEEELELIEDAITEVMDITNGLVTETTINDLFWFETEFIAEILGFEDEEQMWVEVLNR